MGSRKLYRAYIRQYGRRDSYADRNVDFHARNQYLNLNRDGRHVNGNQNLTCNQPTRNDCHR